MKKLLLLFVWLSFSKLNSQIVFCPPGAEWNYEFTQTIFSPKTVNEKISYTSYSVVNGDTIKTLNHLKFYLYCNDYQVTTTLLKQKGDTVFFQNSRTQNTWQILYNFAAQVGQGWQTSILNGFNAPVTFAYIVDSIAYVNINGFSLKRMYLNQKTQVITERFGNEGFLFNFPSNIFDCDGDYLVDNLCYRDNEFGTQAFTSKPCNYTFGLGINSFNKSHPYFELYPNPVIDHLILKTNADAKNIQVRIKNVIGTTSLYLNEALFENSVLNLDLTSLNTGIYFIECVEKDRVLFNSKIIKQ